MDHDTIDRLLTGRLDPADAPPGYAEVARLLAAATAPAGRDELAGERAAVAEFLAVAHAPPPTPIPRRARMPSKLFRVKAAAAVIAAVLSLGGVAAAATGLLPAAVQRMTGNAPAGSGGASATGQEHAATGPAGANTTADSATGEDHAATGPDASGAARDGLCQAWLAGQGDDNGKREDSTAFEALAKAAGGADKIAAYCEDAASDSTAGQGEQHRTTPTTGPPADPGGGQGQGSPPVTTG